MGTTNKDKRIDGKNKENEVEIEYLFPITDISFKGSEFKIGEVIFKKIAPKEILIRKSIVKELFDPYRGNLSDTYAVIKAIGTDLEKMKKNAIKRVDIALNILRVSLSLGMFFRDNSALFSRTEPILERKKGEPDYCYSWDLGMQPRPVEFNPNDMGECRLCFNELSRNLFDMPEGFLEPLRRATFWIDRSITEENLDLKIVCVHIALESMLTSIDHGKKGEDLAYRMLLLNFWADKSAQWSKDVLNMYYRRSEIVHQGKIGISTRDDYQKWRRISIDILITSLSFIKHNQIKSHKEFIKILESEERMKEVVSWLEFYTGYDDKAIKILNWINKKQEDEVTKLQKAKDMLDKGLIDREEYDDVKVAILAKMRQ